MGTTSYPGALDNFTDPTPSDQLNSATVPHASQHANLNSAVEAIQSTLGTNPQGPSPTVKDRIVAAEGAIINLNLAVGERVPGESGSNAPTGTLPNGYVWVNTTTNAIKVWNGTQFVDPGNTGGGSAVWGGITGTLSNQTDLNNALAAKAPSASPTFTGDVVWSGAALRANTNTVATSQTTTSTTYADLATAGPAVTVTTGTKALVIVTAGAFNSVAGNRGHVGIDVSGASTVAASDASSLTISTELLFQASMGIVLTGLTAGSNTFTAKYRTNAGTETFRNRSITVIDLGS